MSITLFDYLLRRALLVFGTFILVMVVFVAKFEHLTDVNAADYAQIARNLAEGKGFTTSALTPLRLAIKPGVENAPELGRGPVYIACLAGAMKLFGATDKTVILGSIFFYLLTLVVVYLVGRFFFSDPVGIFGVVICLISVPLLEQMVSGLEITLLAFLITSLCGLLLWWGRSEKQTAWHWPVVIGLLLGLLYLTRYETLALLPAVIVYLVLLAPRPSRWKLAGLSVLVFVIVVAPWIIRSSLIVGKPFISLMSYEMIMGTDFSPRQVLYREFSTVPPSPLLEAMRNGPDMLKKFIQGMNTFYAALPNVVNLYVMPFFLAGLMLAWARKRYVVFHWCLALAIVLTALVLCLYVPVTNLILAFGPIVAIIAVSWFVELIDQYLQRDAERTPSPSVMDRKRFFILLGWMLVLAYPFLNYLFVMPAARQHPAVPILKALAEEKQYKVVATDIPWWATWYANQTTIFLPNSIAELGQMQKAGIKLDLVYLSPQLLRFPREERMEDWQRALVTRQKAILNLKRVEKTRFPGSLYIPPGVPAPSI
ncbi:MAG: hypothetical protein HPY69_01325 [Armatimonadetes bacterium]|nr:hypothetical protein [Armatimonadota bacterium]